MPNGIGNKMISKQQLQKIKNSAPLLPEPGDIVVLDLIAEIERLRELLEDRHYDFEEEELL